MKKLKVKYLILGLMCLAVIVGTLAWNKNYKTLDTVLPSDIYKWPEEERNQFLLYGNQEMKYQTVVNFTDIGIQNYHELVWSDIDFWNHRGFALYKLGDNKNSLASFYHVLMLEPDNEVATTFASLLLNTEKSTEK